MTRRRAPRPATAAIRASRERAAPNTRLGALQGVWAATVGGQLAAVAEPVAERDGAALVSCADSVWAQELDLMQTQLLERLREQLGEQAPSSLRFRVKADALVSPNP